MGAKSAKKRPSALPRSLTHVFGGSRNNATDFHNYAPHWTTGPPGLPVENLWNYPDQMRYQAWLGQPRPPFHHSLSPRSTSATVSENNESYLQANNEYKSETTGSSSHYSGSNSSMYAPRFPELPISQMHSLLDSSYSSLIWDVRTEPKTLYLSDSASQFYGPNALSFPLTSTGTGHVRLYSTEFPWSIELGPKQRAINASEVLHALYELLSRELDDTVWSLSDTEKRSSIERARKKRSPDDQIRNVDWLGKRFMFKGLYRDDKFIQQRIHPGTAPVAETWLVAFAKP